MCIAIVLHSCHASGVGTIEYGSKYLHLCDSDNSQVLPYLKSAPTLCIVRSHGDETMTVNYITDFLDMFLALLIFLILGQSFGVHKMHG